MIDPYPIVNKKIMKRVKESLWAWILFQTGEGDPPDITASENNAKWYRMYMRAVRKAEAEFKAIGDCYE